MILISDSGSTKTDWALIENKEIIAQITTQGLNPTQQSSDSITKILKEELLPQLDGKTPPAIHFYGAGCAYEEANNRMRKSLSETFPDSAIEINSDLLAAARGCRYT